MLLVHLHDEPLIHIFHLLHGRYDFLFLCVFSLFDNCYCFRDICKLEHTCKRFRHISYSFDNIVWKNKCKILWERKITDMVRMSEDMAIPVSVMDTKDKAEMDALFEKTHNPLHEKVYNLIIIICCVIIVEFRYPMHHSVNRFLYY